MKKLVVLSGGQDSVTCLGKTVKECGAENVSAIHFKYNQKHYSETEAAMDVCTFFKVQLKIVEIDSYAQLTESALFKVSTESTSSTHPQNKNLPSSFVPNRNALFITMAHAYAQLIGADTIVLGVCETDYSGYPDCRRVFIDSIEETLNLASETDIEIETPLMHLDKAATFKLAYDMGFLNIVMRLSRTCYENVEKVNPWGYGCGKCPACILRKGGWDSFMEGRNE